MEFSLEHANNRTSSSNARAVSMNLFMSISPTNAERSAPLSSSRAISQSLNTHDGSTLDSKVELLYWLKLRTWEMQMHNMNLVVVYELSGAALLVEAAHMGDAGGVFEWMVTLKKFSSKMSAH